MYNVMWVNHGKTNINHPPVISIFMTVGLGYHSQLTGWLLPCFTHITLG